MKLSVSVVMVVVCLVIGVLVSSPSFGWNLGLYRGKRDLDYLIDLRDKLERDPTNQALLEKIIAQTQPSNSGSRGNAIAVLSQLSFYDSATGKQIHRAVLPIFVQALNDRVQANKRAALDGLGVLGPYAVSAIPAVKKKLQDPDPIIQQEAGKTLEKLQGYEQN
jgi:hypothetical protein